MNMTIFGLIILISVIVLAVCFLNKSNNNEKNIIDWKNLYNSDKINNLIRVRIREYLNQIKHTEVFENKSMSSYEFFGTTEITYPNYSAKKLIEQLKSSFSENDLIKFFILQDIGNSKYKIGEYNILLNEISTFISKRNEHRTLNYFLNVSNQQAK